MVCAAVIVWTGTSLVNNVLPVCNILNFSNDAYGCMSMSTHVNTLDRCIGCLGISIFTNSVPLHNSSRTAQLHSEKEAFLCAKAVSHDRSHCDCEMLIKTTLPFKWESQKGKASHSVIVFPRSRRNECNRTKA